jgi:hypothetical protein
VVVVVMDGGGRREDTRGVNPATGGTAGGVKILLQTLPKHDRNVM